MKQTPANFDSRIPGWRIVAPSRLLVDARVGFAQTAPATADSDAATLDEAVRYPPGVVRRQNSPDGLLIRGLAPTSFDRCEDGYSAPPEHVDCRSES